MGTNTRHRHEVALTANTRIGADMTEAVVPLTSIVERPLVEGAGDLMDASGSQCASRRPTLWNDMPIAAHGMTPG